MPTRVTASKAWVTSRAARESGWGRTPRPRPPRPRSPPEALRCRRRPAPVPRSPTFPGEGSGPRGGGGARGEEGKGPGRRGRQGPGGGCGRVLDEMTVPASRSPRRCLRSTQNQHRAAHAGSELVEYLACLLPRQAMFHGPKDARMFGARHVLADRLAPAPLGDHEVVEPDGDHGQHDQAHLRGLVRRRIVPRPTGGDDVDRDRQHEVGDQGVDRKGAEPPQEARVSRLGGSRA